MSGYSLPSDIDQLRQEISKLFEVGLVAYNATDNKIMFSPDGLVDVIMENFNGYLASQVAAARIDELERLVMAGQSSGLIQTRLAELKESK